MIRHILWGLLFAPLAIGQVTLTLSPNAPDVYAQGSGEPAATKTRGAVVFNFTSGGKPATVTISNRFSLKPH